MILVWAVASAFLFRIDSSAAPLASMDSGAPSFLSFLVPISFFSEVMILLNL
jgi:hypothetical protein